jgi:protein-S-isoprenylcysteine O-methyltransferase Ste14
MTMVALGLFVAYLAVTFGLRSWIQRRRTGSAGFHGVSGKPGSLEWWGGVLFVVALIGAPVGLGLDLANVLAPIESLAAGGVRWAGLVLFVAGFIATFAAQMAMGASWRIGVRADEVTALVTRRPFSIVRNPIFAAMLLTGSGLALLVPNVVSIASWALALVAIELQVRFVEEPYLRRVHGEAYLAYGSRVGRFMPWMGRFRPLK